MQPSDEFIALRDRREKLKEEISSNEAKLKELTKELQELNDLRDDIKVKLKRNLVIDVIDLVLPNFLLDIPFDIVGGIKRVRLKELLSETEEKMSSIMDKKKKIREKNEKLKAELTSVEEAIRQL